MNFINYNAHTFCSSDSNGESQDAIVNVNETATEKVLLRLIIETDFYSKHAAVDNAQKFALWNLLHHDFCHHPDVIEYASTYSGQAFARKYQSVQYVKDRLRKIKEDFREVIVDVRITGSGGPSPQSRYEHYDDMKDITLGDPSFWPDIIKETDCARDGRFSGLAIYTLQPDGCSYEVSYIGEPEFAIDAENDQSVGFVPTPETAPLAPEMTAMTAMTEGQGRLQMYEGIARLAGNSARVSMNIEEGLSRMLGEFSQMRELLAQTAEDMRRRDLAAAKSHHLDRLAWARIEENTTRARKEIAKNDL
ncbi:hypothetical protein CLU79DRAFT_884446 [Phycomyces nitens]|nr:hypothetical protein CLU79DRAFT_884446 [Phycomyces nitens]